MNDISEAYRRIERIMQGVPGVTDERKQEWVERVLRVDPNRLLWHVDRLMGFGGSDIGTLVCENEKMGRAVFTTARRIVAGKLLMAAPEKSNATMMVGSVMEPVVREAFHAQMAEYDCHTDEKTYAAIADLQSLDRNFTRKRPWLVGNPDDIVMLRGRRFLVDYKVTLQAEKESEGDESTRLDVFSDYEYQLHDYDLICDEVGASIEGMLLAKYVVDKDGFFVLRIGQVPFDPVKRAQILRAGDAAWALRNRGDLPPYPEARRIDFIAENPEATGLVPVAEKFYAYDALAKRAREVADEFKEELKEEIGSYVPGAVSSFTMADLISMSMKPKLNVEAVRENFGSEFLDSVQGPGELHPDLLESKVTELALACNKNPVEVLNECRGKMLDEDLLDQRIRDKGADPDAFRTSAVTIRIKTDKQVKAATEEKASTLIQGAFGDLSAVVGTERLEYLKRKQLADAEKAEKAARRKPKAAVAAM